MENSPSARFDRYEVLAPLGVGGMGEVVKARALGPHGFEKIVAIKRIRAEWAEQEIMAERFVREARIAASLQHANIVQVFDFGRHGDELFIVMEYVDGLSLDSILAALAKEGKRMTLAQTLGVALDVARALDSAHTLPAEGGGGAGIIHRDVSPANILVSRQGVVKLTDFGIAAWTSQQGRTSLIAGKPLYMAPEQLRGDPLDARADLFAVGIVTYEMLTGARPWKGMIDAAPGATLESVGYQPPSRVLPNVPKDVDALLERLLSPDLSGRLATARELTKEILALSYRCQIVIDSNELAPLLVEKGGEAHAPTLPQYMNKSRTLIATGVTAEGVTVLKTADDDAAVPARASVDVVKRRGLPAWAWTMIALFAVGAALIGAYALGGADDEEVVVAAPPEPSPPEQVGVVASPEPLDPPEPEPPIAAPEPPAPVEEVVPEARPRAPRQGRGERPARTPAQPAASGDPGELDVWSRPWSEIWIDGVRQAQNAPARGLRLPAGRHRVRLVNPVSGLSAERTVEIPAGGRAQLRVVLDPGAGSSSEAPEQ